MDSSAVGSRVETVRRGAGEGALPGLVFAFRIEADGRAEELPLDTAPDLAADGRI